MSQVEIELPERRPQRELPPVARTSRRRVTLVSIAAFSAIVFVGAVIGMWASADASSETLAASVAVPVVVEGVSVQAVPEPVIEATVAPAPTTAPTTVPPVTTAPPTSTAPPTTTPPTTAVPTSTAPPTTAIAFLELPKGVYDRLTLEVGDVVIVNVAANDKVAGDLEGVELTGLGELAPGFALEFDGTLSGTALTCGRWQAQYELISTNPATGTSWIDVVVTGCGGSAAEV